MFITHQQDREHYNHNMTTGSKSIENVTKYKNLGMGLRDQNYIQEIFERRIKVKRVLATICLRTFCNGV